MSGHKFGPWEVDGPADNQIVWSGAEDRVCFLAHSNGRDDERDLAMGRLIAAAPELYEALTEVLAVLRKEAPGTVLNNHRFDALGVKAYAALAKAEGRSRQTFSPPPQSRAVGTDTTPQEER